MDAGMAAPPAKATLPVMPQARRQRGTAPAATRLRAALLAIKPSRVPWLRVVGLAAVKPCPMVFAGRHGWHRDELYYLRLGTRTPAPGRRTYPTMRLCRRFPGLRDAIRGSDR